MGNFFAKNLRHLRVQKGVSQNELSRITKRICEAYNQTADEKEKLSPIAQSSIARWEAGENSPSVDNLVLLRNALGVDLVDLIGKDLSKEIDEENIISDEELDEKIEIFKSDVIDIKRNLNVPFTEKEFLEVMDALYQLRDKYSK